IGYVCKCLFVCPVRVLLDVQQQTDRLFIIIIIIIIIARSLALSLSLSAASIWRLASVAIGCR
ncbi:MAG: hypothetical protein N6V49_15110, partial [Serratia symbiotica]|nr:hypothetical protein [Serratia symbiotica]